MAWSQPQNLMSVPFLLQKDGSRSVPQFPTGKTGGESQSCSPGGNEGGTVTWGSTETPSTAAMTEAMPGGKLLYSKRMNMAQKPQR